jgi:hypothetical protein
MVNSLILDTEDIQIESIWSSPSAMALFLELCEIFIQIRNHADRIIQIQKIECLFECDGDVEPYVPSVTPYQVVEPGHLTNPIRIKFEADIVFKAHTNCYSIVVHYLIDDNLKIFRAKTQKYFIFSPPGPNEKKFFISHKDPEDTIICRRFASFLGKLGFIGYMSEDDRRPGIDLWKEKIPSNIKTSVAMVIVWTKKASKNPENIYREIDMAKSFNKRFIMAIENNVPPPSEKISTDIEYFTVTYPASVGDIKKLACHIEDSYRRGVYTRELKVTY